MGDIPIDKNPKNIQKPLDPMVCELAVNMYEKLRYTHIYFIWRTRKAQ